MNIPHVLSHIATQVTERFGIEKNRSHNQYRHCRIHYSTSPISNYVAKLAIFFHTYKLLWNYF